MLSLAPEYEEEEESEYESEPVSEDADDADEPSRASDPESDGAKWSLDVRRMAGETTEDDRFRRLRPRCLPS